MGYKGKINVAHKFPLHVFLVYSTQHCSTIQCSHIQLCANSLEVTVNSCTCPNYTNINQLGGIIVIAQVARDLWLLVNKPGLFTAINPWPPVLILKCL